jgi:protein-S-isoprenylcysteine O-methyltransferase Ste14
MQGMRNRRLRITNSVQVLMRIPVPWVFVLAYLVGVGLQYVFPLPLYPEAEHSLGAVVGGSLFVIGAVIAGWAWIIFRRAGTTRVPGEQSTRLVTWGPYRATRNPMYVGLALAYIAESILLRHLWPILVLPLLAAYLNWAVIPVEEAKLREVFQSEYDEYCAHVRRWF